MVETKLDTAMGFEENWTLEEESTSVLNDVRVRGSVCGGGRGVSACVCVHAHCTRTCCTLEYL